MSELSRCVCGCPIQAHKIKGGQCLACACNGYQRDTEYQAPTHPAVEVLNAIESKLRALADDQQFSVAYLRGWIEEARKAKGV